MTEEEMLVYITGPTKEERDVLDAAMAFARSGESFMGPAANRLHWAARALYKAVNIAAQAASKAASEKERSRRADHREAGCDGCLVCATRGTEGETR